MNTRTVPPEFVNALLFPLQSQGVDIADFLAARNIVVPFAESGVTLPVSQRDYNRIVLAALEYLQDESGGVAPVRNPFGTSRMLIFAVLKCSNLEQAMRRAIEFNFSCVEPRARDVSLALSVGDDGRLATLSHFRRTDGAGKPSNHEGLLCNLAMWLRICSWLIGRRIEIVAADCAAQVPLQPERVRHFIQCPVRYGQPANRLGFGAAMLTLPIVRSEADLEQFLRTAPYQVVVGDAVGEESMVSQIRKSLAISGGQLPSFEALADQLHMSARTLRRRLDEEGISYQQVKDDVRRDTSCVLLTTTELTISDIAEKIGFSDASAFHRSFRKWTGVPPGIYRNSFSGAAATGG